MLFLTEHPKCDRGRVTLPNNMYAMICDWSNEDCRPEFPTRFQTQLGDTQLTWYASTPNNG